MADAAPVGCRLGAHDLAKVELYFGGRATDARAWRRFLAQVVTPRFGGGLTSFDGIGQWHGTHGLVHEATHVLVIFYRPDATSDARIETIRTIYKARFAQRSVLRADSRACVGF